MDLARLFAVWCGESQDPYAQAAVTGTMALALKTCGAAPDQASAQELAAQLWSARDRAHWIRQG
jgi:hypothetical protein